MVVLLTCQSPPVTVGDTCPAPRHAVGTASPAAWSSSPPPRCPPPGSSPRPRPDCPGRCWPRPASRRPGPSPASARGLSLPGLSHRWRSILLPWFAEVWSKYCHNLEWMTCEICCFMIDHSQTHPHWTRYLRCFEIMIWRPPPINTNKYWQWHYSDSLWVYKYHVYRFLKFGRERKKFL